MNTYVTVINCLLNKAIGDKFERSVLSAGSAIEFYLIFGTMPGEDEIKAHGKELASYRYQGRILGSFLDAGDNNIIDTALAEANLNQLDDAANRLLGALKKGFAMDELVRLSKSAEEKAAQLFAPTKPD